MNNFNQEIEQAKRYRWTWGIVILSIISLATGGLIYSYFVPGEYQAFGLFVSSVVILTIIVMMIMIHQNINPRYWWPSVWGYEVFLDPPKGIRDDRSLRLEEINLWLKNTLPETDYVVVNSWRYQFLKKSQAAMFKLAWYQ